MLLSPDGQRDRAGLYMAVAVMIKEERIGLTWRSFIPA